MTCEISAVKKLFLSMFLEVVGGVESFSYNLVFILDAAIFWPIVWI
jgi:hypothetical protein